MISFYAIKIQIIDERNVKSTAKSTLSEKNITKSLAFEKDVVYLHKLDYALIF